MTKYHGDVGAIWSGDLTADELQRRFRAFTGIAQKKSAMAVEILERELGVEVAHLDRSDVAYDVHLRRVFLGLAGGPGTKSHAHGIVSAELGNGRSIVVLCLDDLRRLEDTEQLVDLCIERRFELEAFRTYHSL